MSSQLQRRGYGHSKRRADRTIEPVGEPRAIGLVVVVRSSGCRLDASPTTDTTPGTEIPTVTAYKQAWMRLRRWPWLEASLKPYWGKPTVRNFRGGRGNEVNGLMTFCHATRKGGYIGSHWPNHVRASALLGVSSPFRDPTWFCYISSPPIFFHPFAPLRLCAFVVVPLASDFVSAG